MSKPTWPEKTIARLKELWAEGDLTMEDIADLISDRQFRVSRSAVAGQLRRLGLVREPQGPRPKHPPGSTVRERKRMRLKVWREKRKLEAPAPDAVPVEGPPPAPQAVAKDRQVLVPVKIHAKPWARRVRSLPADGTPVPLLDLGSGCKWPVDHKDGEFLFCNRAKHPAARYCDLHGP